ncbi:hypothetical protein BC628DRAFT_208490 [Trametes gibbosa]|nr:hypothetical protein BC628DRAFT_208490 [Trametes gibbosa]
MLRRSASYTIILWEPELDGRTRFHLPVQLEEDSDDTAGTETALRCAWNLIFAAIAFLAGISILTESQKLMRRLYLLRTTTYIHSPPSVSGCIGQSTSQSTAAQTYETSPQYFLRFRPHMHSREVPLMHDKCERCLTQTCPATHAKHRSKVVTVEPSEYRPLRDRLLAHPRDIFEMVSQITDTLHSLYHDAGLLHGNVSYTNILWELEAPNGPVHFILNDFDLEIDTNDRDATGPISQHRTGTLPFMAIELLENMAKPVGSQTVLHQLYHDYESLFWVALWSAMKTERNITVHLHKEIRAVVSRRETGDYETIAHRKNSLFATQNFLKLPFTPNFKSLRRFLWTLFQILSLAETAIGVELSMTEEEAKDAKDARSAEEVKHEWISRDKIQEVVNAHRRVPT